MHLNKLKPILKRITCNYGKTVTPTTKLKCNVWKYHSPKKYWRQNTKLKFKHSDDFELWWWWRIDFPELKLKQKNPMAPAELLDFKIEVFLSFRGVLWLTVTLFHVRGVQVRSQILPEYATSPSPFCLPNLLSLIYTNSEWGGSQT